MEEAVVSSPGKCLANKPPSDCETLHSTSYTYRFKKKDLPPPIDPQLQLKWGLALLGKEKADQYLAWIEHRLGEDNH